MKTPLSLLLLLAVLCPLNGYGASHDGTSGIPSKPPSVDRSWSWTKKAFVPCGGFGVNGSFSVNVDAKVESASDHTTISSLALWVYSASLTKGSASVSARLVVRKGETELLTVTLSRPKASESIVERKPKADESRSIYLPKGKTVNVPLGAKISFTVTVTVQTASGTCVLGTSEMEIDPAVAK